MITVPPAFTITQVATVPGARELAFAPDGDLYVGTRGADVYIVRRADAENPESARVYVRIDDAPDAGVAYGNKALYVGTQHGIWRVQNGHPVKIASVRAGNPPPGSDGDVHTTTSVTLDGSTVYAAVGSSCNACVETDPTRATVGKVTNGRYVPIAVRIRNAIALAVAPSTHALWASDAGQDELPPGHPYEFFDNVSAHRVPADYGWPFCYENHRRKEGASANCASVAIPLVVFPPYETPIGAVLYPPNPHGRYAFPAQYRGGAFVTLHGSWHGPGQRSAGVRAAARGVRPDAREQAFTECRLEQCVGAVERIRLRLPTGRNVDSHRAAHRHRRWTGGRPLRRRRRNRGNLPYQTEGCGPSINASLSDYLLLPCVNPLVQRPQQLSRTPHREGIF